MLTDEQYAESGGEKCPFCGGNDMETGDFEVDGPTGWTDDLCVTCGKEWRSCYSLVGFIPEPSEPGDPDEDGEEAEDEGS